VLRVSIRLILLMTLLVASGCVAPTENQQALRKSAAEERYTKALTEEIRRAVMYPDDIGENRPEGAAVVRFTVEADGSVSKAAIARSSGSRILDQAALETIQRAAPFRRIPRATGRTSWTFSLPVYFSPGDG